MLENYGDYFEQMKFLVIIILGMLVTSCSTTTGMVLQTPSSITITTPMSVLDVGVPITQKVYDLAQTHCKKNNKDAIHINSWHVPFNANYHKFECKN